MTAPRDNNPTDDPPTLDYASKQRRAVEDLENSLLKRPRDLKTFRKWWATIYLIGFAICAGLMFFVFKFIFWYKALMEDAMNPR
jgi:hypothetical protein